MESYIDVILPTYNHSKFLEDVIFDFNNQLFKSFKLIIVNDGSTDATKEILKTYEKHNQIKIIHTKNNGLPTALNIGHANGNSPFCTWIETDNIYKDNFLLELILKIKEGYDLVKGNYFIMNETGDSIFMDIKKYSGYFNLGQMGSCFLYKREIWEKFNYDPNVLGAEDLKFYYQVLFNNYKIGHIDKVLGIHQQHKNTLTNQIPEIVKESTKKIFREFNNEISNMGMVARK